jgi:hypothetical protein
MTASERQSALKDLLTQYHEYQRATTPEEKQRIGDSMFYADPIVWVVYKYAAYKESTHPLLTWGDLIHHSFGHDGICGKRLHYIARWCALEKGIDVFDETVMRRAADLSVVATHPLFLEIAADESFMDTWRQYEYEKTAGVVTKWKSYEINANDLQNI